MNAPADASLWLHVRKTVTPLGQPCRGERRLRRDRPPAGIDLHGHTVQVAYDGVRAAIASARAEGRREMVVVTGRSGRIRVEFPAWADLHPDVRSLEPLNGGGAYRVKIAGTGRRAAAAIP